MPIRFKRAIQFSMTLATLILIMTLVFMQVENYTFFESFWMTIVSVLAIGYGDMVPVSNAGKIFAMFLIPVTMGFSTYLLTFIAASMIEGRLSKKWERKKMDKQISRMNDHYIICGYGRVGEQVVKEFSQHNYQAVIVDNDEGAVEGIPEDIPYIIADAKKNAVLEHAGIEKAKGIVITTADDATNVFITLTAKGLNEDIEAIVRAEAFETEDKIKRAGADHVVNTSDLGGRRMALSMIKPTSMHYIDSIIHAESDHYQVEEIKISHGSFLTNNKVTELPLHKEYGVSILGVQREGEFISLADKDLSIQPEDILIIFGNSDNIKSFKQKTTA
ncbi:voltage-gated potassium channel [Thalassobacillus cyri]|uniref:Voltage-gated potassium channel n=1 Tax=Thalassobacillus cyri TaxID=571932 RepID=A0A1H3YWX4_9BACI|nr:potassium channel protein [Thalassobacillus cyri]SEA15917.1 voltage-gated potassium channel [Thalassobacillus cyri]